MVGRGAGNVRFEYLVGYWTQDKAGNSASTVEMSWTLSFRTCKTLGRIYPNSPTLTRRSLGELIRDGERNNRGLLS